MSDLTRAVRNWLDDSGYGDPDGVSVSAEARAGGICCVILRQKYTLCTRCKTKGPSIGTRLAGRCRTCRDLSSAYLSLKQILKANLIPALAEEFTFWPGRDERYILLRDGVHDNGLVVTLFLDGVRAGSRS